MHSYRPGVHRLVYLSLLILFYLEWDSHWGPKIRPLDIKCNHSEPPNATICGESPMAERQPSLVLDGEKRGK